MEHKSITRDFVSQIMAHITTLGSEQKDVSLVCEIYEIVSVIKVPTDLLDELETVLCQRRSLNCCCPNDKVKDINLYLDAMIGEVRRQKASLTDEHD